MSKDKVVLKLLVISMFLGGCATPPQIAEQAIKANLAMEQAHNQILLLNVVRAYNRRPMHFTGFTAINGPIGTGKPTFSLATPFGPDFNTNIYSLTTGFTPDVPSFQTAIYDGHEFIRGFTTPITPKLAHFYLEQGWPQEMILHLFVREIEIVNGEGESVKRYRNYPPTAKDFRDFQQKISELSKCKLITETAKPTQYGPDIPAQHLQNAQMLAVSKGADFAIQGVPHDKKDANDKLLQPEFYRIIRSSPEVMFKFQAKIKGDKCLEVTNGAGEGNKQENQEQKIQVYLAGAEEIAQRQADKILKKQGTPTPPALQVIFSLRSPEAMVYYLGELARTQNRQDSSMPPASIGFDYPREPDQLEPLFVLSKNPNQSEMGAILEVEYEGDKYVIPRNAGRSMHVLSLIHQLIGLQKKAADLPATTTVRIIP